MHTISKKISIPLISVCLFALITFLLQGQYWIISIPIILLILVISFIKIQYLENLIIISVALSIPLSFFSPNLSIDIFLPSEPLLILTMFLIILRLIQERGFNRAFFYHPISILIFFHLLWMFITSITSVDPLISFKALFVRIWFIAIFYYLAYRSFIQNPKRIRQWVLIFAFATVIVIIYTFSQHIYYGGTKKIAYWASFPFYKDHTSYGALLAMYIPFLLGLAFSNFFKKTTQILLMVLTALFILALIFSYSRAAWVSIIGAIGIYIAIKLWKKSKISVIVILIAGIFLLFIRGNLIMHIQQNDQESSMKLSEHLASVSNIKSDISNLERINRWKSAYKMFLEKPVFGFGPGTYMFNYAPYQMYQDKTPISTNSGDLGNAHSEYLGALSESGLLGLLSFVSIVIVISFYAVRLYYKLENKQFKLYVLCAFLGLITYFLHGLLNNFLDTDKISLPFWSFIAIIVTIDILNKQQNYIGNSNAKRVTSSE